MKTSSKPMDLNVTLEKVADMRRESDAFKRRDMLVDFFGSNGVGLIDLHQNPRLSEIHIPTHNLEALDF